MRETEENRKLWNELTNVHMKGSSFYPIDEFLKGKIVLKNIEKTEVGDVKGKDLLHLQCHFGMDTLSWARLGANVTGVDISDEAIEQAKKLSTAINVEADFLRSDILELEGKINKKYDIVFASYGALYWIPNLKKWMQIASSYLKENGFIYIIDGHSIGDWLNRCDLEKSILNHKFSYFDRSTQKYETTQDYADPTFKSKASEFGWHYTLSDLINAISSAGLMIDHFNEFPSFDMIYDNGSLKPVGEVSNYPVMFSIKASKGKI